MTKLSFIHLSDIHFFKRSGNPTDIDEDLRTAIITDISTNAIDQLEDVRGILVCGDIAFSGNEIEYENANKFLINLTTLFKINISDVYCVPGNHDVDQNIPKASLFVHDCQCKLDEFDSLDKLDIEFDKRMNDPLYNNVYFKTIEKYNLFASRFDCNIHPKKINWFNYFDLGNDLKLKLHGINSCFISNADDHSEKYKNSNRLMYIGQAQIPSRESDTVVMTLCHHPPDCWKFQSSIIEKINKRADIQLYGHKHHQSITLSTDNIIITSGATHPVRDEDWNPRYNWITIECEKLNNDRVVKTRIYPRILDNIRDRFIPDTEICIGDNKYIEHRLYIDQKRDRDLKDYCNQEDKISNKYESNYDGSINIRDLKYQFFELQYGSQLEILLKHNLISEENENELIPNIINDIISRAISQNKLNEFYDEIRKVGMKK